MSCAAFPVLPWRKSLRPKTDCLVPLVWPAAGMPCLIWAKRWQATQAVLRKSCVPKVASAMLSWCSPRPIPSAARTRSMVAASPFRCPMQAPIRLLVRAVLFGLKKIYGGRLRLQENGCHADGDRLHKAPSCWSMAQGPLKKTDAGHGYAKRALWAIPCPCFLHRC